VVFDERREQVDTAGDHSTAVRVHDCRTGCRTVEGEPMQVEDGAIGGPGGETRSAYCVMVLHSTSELVVELRHGVADLRRRRDVRRIAWTVDARQFGMDDESHFLLLAVRGRGEAAEQKARS
jgi:hypothetical protein